jgi:hypothetical protein
VNRDTLKEPILPDDYPVYGDYLYVADGKVIRSDLHGVTVRHLKHNLGATEIRRCDIEGRRKEAAE